MGVVKMRYENVDGDKTKKILSDISSGLNKLLKEKLETSDIVFVRDLFEDYWDICPEEEEDLVEYLCGRLDPYDHFEKGDLVTLGE